VSELGQWPQPEQGGELNFNLTLENHDD
jgi:hypothetical protein